MDGYMYVYVCIYDINSINEDGRKTGMNISRCHTELALLRTLQDEKLAQKTCRPCLTMKFTAYAEKDKSYILFTGHHTALL
jgi:hypothetical protein